MNAFRLSAIAAAFAVATPFVASQAMADSTSSSTISRIDSVGQLSSLTTVQDFNGIAVDSYWQHVFVAGSRYAPFQAIPMSASAIPWQVQSVWNDNPEQFTAVTVDPTDEHVYFATRDGFIRGFTGQGTARFNAQTLPDHRCEAIVVICRTK